jgi:hypothetical protein
MSVIRIYVSFWMVFTYLRRAQPLRNKQAFNKEINSTEIIECNSWPCSI